MSGILLRVQNIFPLMVRDIPQIINIGGQSNLSKWTYADYADEVKRRDSISLAYKSNVDTVSLPDRENISGFIVSRLIMPMNSINKKYDSDDFQHTGECEILNIAVHPAFRRNGIGRKLFEATVEKCLSQNVESIWLEVRKNNDEAVSFYKKNGFEVIYTRKDYYQNPVDDALVMKAALQCSSLSNSSKLGRLT
jgi:ribosomal protein S18 acetylase RimI-like enzyme